ncbi:MAG TPA: xanthine dehydrogenase family protein subunit M [Thermodesulfobacteriota bacterium]|nr:xanthine dehydrogenase family protein subunit M [Thermodesulfobacteriota bacterium]
MTEVFLPETLEALWPLLERHREALIYAGGTDLLVKRRIGLLDPPSLICLERLAALRDVADQGEGVWIGAGSTHADLLKHPLILTHFPVLIEALKVLGSPLVRESGTIGGNIVTASPAGDTLPPLMVLGAELEIQSANQHRSIPIRDFIQGPGRTLLAPGEILAGIRIKKQPEFTVHHFEKVGQRRALAIALVSLAALLQIDENQRVQKARLAWGSVGPTIVTCREAEAVLEGNPLSLETLGKAALPARRAVSPIDDVRASADYRRQVAGNLLLRLSEFNRA